MKKFLCLFPLLLVLTACEDYNQPDNHTPITDKKLESEYFFKCLEAVSHFPGQHSIKYNTDVVTECHRSANQLATRYNGKYGLDK